MRIKYSKLPLFRRKVVVHTGGVDAKAYDITTGFSSWQKYISWGRVRELHCRGYRGILSTMTFFCDLARLSNWHEEVIIGGKKTIWLKGHYYYPYIFNIAPSCVAIMGLLEA